ncbi:MAG: methionyl aminopeptidase [SAR324 cluster bacterium]|nr:methionyl aminopeptidase [SAR324 cluster bacterium]
MKNISRNDNCWCGSGKKYKKCHLAQDTQQQHTKVQKTSQGIIIKTEEQIEGIRKSCQLAKKTLDMVEERIKSGVTTEDINQWVHQYTLEHKAYPAPLNYKKFPKSVCTSLNNVICHGIPDKTLLKEGDIINVDVTPILNGFYGDSSRMFIIGSADKVAVRLVQVAKECLDLGIQEVRPFNTIGDIGHVIQKYAEGQGFSVVREFAGHGTGIEFHEAPQILHYGSPKTGEIMRPNMIFTIEPMINSGRPDSMVLSDGWTAVTVDGSLSAQWEHTVLVTESGVEVLTA